MGQSSSSIVLSEIKTEVLLDSDDPPYQNFLLQQYGERLEKLSQHDKLSNFPLDAGFLSVVENGLHDERHKRSHTISCSGMSWIHSSKRRRSITTERLDPRKHWKLQPVTCTVNMELRSELCLWAETTLTPGSEFLMDQISLSWLWTTTKQQFQKISSKNIVKPECQGFCMPIEGESKTTKKGTCWLFTESSFTTRASRRRWSGSILEDQEFSSESIPTVYSLVWQSIDSMLGSKRRSQKEISLLHWWFRSNCLFPSSSRTFRTHSYWSFITGQCGNSE